MSLSALRRMNARWTLDLDAGPQMLSSATPIAEQDQFSQEFQLQSGETSPVRWVAGLYYIHLDERYDPTTSYLWRFLFGISRRPDPADPVRQRHHVILGGLRPGDLADRSSRPS